MTKKYYRLTKAVSPTLFERRDSLKKLLDEAEDDIMTWVRNLHFNGKLIGIDPNKIKSIKYLAGTVTIEHEVSNWRQFADDDETRMETTRIEKDDFFHPEIIKDEPRQLDMDEVENG